MQFNSDYAECVKNHAENAFRLREYNCAEAVFEALLVCAGLECPPSLRRAANGFGRGMGGAGCACGALVGSIMAAGIMLNDENDPRPSNPYCNEIAKKLHDAFRAKHGATCCRILHRNQEFDSPEQLESCAKRTAETAELASKIIRAAFDRSEITC